MPSQAHLLLLLADVTGDVVQDPFVVLPSLCATLLLERFVYILWEDELYTLSLCLRQPVFPRLVIFVWHVTYCYW